MLGRQKWLGIFSKMFIRKREYIYIFKQLRARHKKRKKKKIYIMASQGRRLQTRPIAWWRDWHHLHITLGTTPFLVFFLRLSRLSDGLFSSFWTRTAVAPHYWPLACTTFKLQSLLARTCIIRPQKHNGGPLGGENGTCPEFSIVVAAAAHSTHANDILVRQ